MTIDCPLCTGTVEIDNPDGLVKPEDEVGMEISLTSGPTSPVPMPSDDVVCIKIGRLRWSIPRAMIGEMNVSLPPEVIAGISFADWQDAHQCDGCPTYERYKGNPFGEHCATCVRTGQVADNYGKA